MVCEHCRGLELDFAVLPEELPKTWAEARRIAGPCPHCQEQPEEEQS